MSPAHHTAEEGFAAIIQVLGDKPGVKEPDAPGTSARRFGSTALRVHGRIFAMVSRGRLVLKLPPQRVRALIDSGDGQAFDAGKGSPMKEWVSLEPARQQNWLELATEALEFVGSRRSEPWTI
jgi:TfoX/Sxy family transcriptional regulator of competence genes